MQHSILVFTVFTATEMVLIQLTMFTNGNALPSIRVLIALFRSIVVRVE